MARMLLEDCQGPFIIDRAHIVQESVGGYNFTKVPGRLSVCGVKNGNNRRYNRSVWEKNLAEGSPLRKLMERNATFGLLEHPKDGQVDLNSPIAVILTEANLEGDDVVGAFRILNTPEGNKLKALIEAGWVPTVSSRGFGSLAKGADGVDEVQDDYVCEGWDPVFKPSFTQATLAPVIETPAPAKKGEPTLKESVTKPAAADLVPSTKTTLQETTTVDIKSTINVIESMSQVTPSKLTAEKYASGIARLQEAHKEVAAYVAEDGKRSWEGTQLHEKITSIEKSWATHFEAPVKEVARLRESQVKLVKVTKVVAETALAHREKATKALTENKKLTEMCTELTRRGRAWMERAKQGGKVEESKEYKVATLALEKLGKKYRDLHKAYVEEVTLLGRTVLSNEFSEKLKASPELAERLNAAVNPEQIVAIREELSGEKKEKKDDKKDEKKDEKSDKKDEKKDEKKDDKKNESLTPPPVVPAPRTLEIMSTKRDVTNFDESLDFIQQLSKSSKQLVG